VGNDGRGEVDAMTARRTAVRYAAVGYLAAVGLALAWINRAINQAVTWGGRL
jgi:hypothetical protein